MKRLLKDIRNFAPDDILPLDLEERDDRIVIHLQSEREMNALKSYELEKELIEKGHHGVSVDAPNDKFVLIVWLPMFRNFPEENDTTPKEISEDGYDEEFKDQWTRADQILQRLKQMDGDEDKRRELMYHIASAEHRGLEKGREDSAIKQ